MNSLNAKVGDKIPLTEIMPRAGIGRVGTGEVIEVCKTEEGDDAYLVKAEDGKYRMMTFQGKWGYAYNYFDEYKLKK
jgi:hypothetical protein